MATVLNFDNIYKLIDAGEKESARRQLATFLYKDSGNTKAWWVYAQIAEDAKQRYSILSAMLELPADDYTAKARGALSRLPYQDLPANDPFRLLAQKRGQGGKKNGYWMIAAAIIAGIVVLGGLLITGSGRSSVAVASAPNTAQPKSGAIVVTRTPLPTNEVSPSATPTIAPTMTFTKVASPTNTVAMATAVTDLPSALIPLEIQLSKSTHDLITMSTDTLDLLSDISKYNVQNIATISKTTGQMQKLRNGMLLLNLSGLSPDVQTTMVYPVTLTFTQYANAVLSITDLKMKANQLQISLLSTSPSDSHDLQKQLDDLTSQIAQQAKTMQALLDKLNSALTTYSVYAMTRAVKSQVSSKAIILTSDATPTIELSAGTYTVAYELDGQMASNVGITLVPVGSSSAKPIQIAKTVTQDDFGLPGGIQTVRIPAGKYQIQIAQQLTWIIAFDQQ